MAYPNETLVPLRVLNSPRYQRFVKEQLTTFSCGQGACRVVIGETTGRRVDERRIIKETYEAQKGLVAVKEMQENPKERQGRKYHQLYFTGMKRVLNDRGIGGVVILDPTRRVFNSILRDRLPSIVEGTSPRIDSEIKDNEYHYTVIMEELANGLRIADTGCKDQLVYDIKMEDFFYLWGSYDGHRRITPVWKKDDPANEIYRRRYGRLGLNF